ncbi:hypothetical protein JCM10207_003675 [Rhodosporidiobolus poonsookiae]
MVKDEVKSKVKIEAVRRISSSGEEKIVEGQPFDVKLFDNDDEPVHLLQDLYKPTAFAVVWLKPHGGGVIGSLVEARRGELSTGKAYTLTNLSPPLALLAAQHLLLTNNPSALSTLSLDALSSLPSSIIGALLALFRTLTMRNHARREQQLDVGQLEPESREAQLLAEATASERWQVKLRALSVKESAFASGRAFRSGVELSPRLARAIRADTRRRLALASASPDATLCWSPHLAASNDPVVPARGFLAAADHSGRLNTLLEVLGAQRQALHLRKGALCGKCESGGFDSCLYLFLDAVLYGWLNRAVGAAAAAESVCAWVDEIGSCQICF